MICEVGAANDLFDLHEGSLRALALQGTCPGASLRPAKGRSHGRFGMDLQPNGLQT